MKDSSCTHLIYVSEHKLDKVSEKCLKEVNEITRSCCLWIDQANFEFFNPAASFCHNFYDISRFM